VGNEGELMGTKKKRSIIPARKIGNDFVKKVTFEVGLEGWEKVF